MKIAFYLPRVYYNPGGGAKIVLEYADYLANKGHSVSVYYHIPSISFQRPYNVKRNIRIGIDYLMGELYGCSRWFALNKNVKQKIITNVNEIDPCDIIVATAIQLVEPILNLPQQYKNKVYLIQGFETWEFPEKRIFSIYKKSKNNIVISRWLKNIVDGNSNESSYLIPNSIDSNIFFDSNQHRIPHSITFHYRSAPIKGCKYAVKIITELYKLYPDLKVKVISTEKKIPELPKCCEVLTNVKPSKVAEINNSCEIFMCTTIEEGFGLPGLEAMACGCALVTTNYAAVYDYAEDNYNALISPIKDTDKMLENIIRIFEDTTLKSKLSRNAVNTAMQRSKDASLASMEKYFEKLVNEENDKD